MNVPLGLLLTILSAAVTTIAASVATRFQLLPDVFDLTTIPTGSGLFGLVFAGYGALRRYPIERVGRLTLGGNLFGAIVAAVALLIGVIAQ